MTGRKVLVVDDTPSVVKTLRFLLEKEGYAVHEANDGAAALRIARAVRPDLILLDVVMPGVDGFEVLRDLRGDPDFQQTLVVVLSAKGQELDRERALALCADEFWMKPFSPSSSVQRLRELFERRGAGRRETGNQAPAGTGAGCKETLR